jgi:hypothetical protein
MHVCVCVCVCARVCIYECMYMYVCVRVRLHGFIYVTFARTICYQRVVYLCRLIYVRMSLEGEVCRCVTVSNPSIYLSIYLFRYAGIYISVYNFLNTDRQTGRQTDRQTRHRTRDARTSARAEVEAAGRVGAEDGRGAAAAAVRADKCSTSRGGVHSLRVLGVQSVP